MRIGARLKAAQEVLEDILQHHRPANVALADWGRRHRFAGSGDRAAIGTVVYDSLRRQSSLAHRMKSSTPRTLVLAAAPEALELTVEDVVAAAIDGPHAIGELTVEEKAGLQAPEAIADAPSHIQADVAEWLLPSLERVFPDNVIEQGQAMAHRAPVDVRVNTLKADRDKVMRALQRYAATATPHAPNGLRVGAPEGGRKMPQLENEAGHGKGWFEIQDEGSQIAALMSGASPRLQVLDLCAGAGGKTLALAAAMNNTGQLYVYDKNRHQLRPIFERLKRAGVRNVQVLEAGDEDALRALGPKFDVVLVDAPCTGSGTWRRRPDSKWKLKPANLAQRIDDQRLVLGQAAMATKPGGRLTYVTCSLLPEENQDQVAWFLETHPEFAINPFEDLWRAHINDTPPTSAATGDGLLLTPLNHGTDGFFICSFKKVTG